MRSFFGFGLFAVASLVLSSLACNEGGGDICDCGVPEGPPAPPAASFTDSTGAKWNVWNPELRAVEVPDQRPGLEPPEAGLDIELRQEAPGPGSYYVRFARFAPAAFAEAGLPRAFALTGTGPDSPSYVGVGRGVQEGSGVPMAAGEITLAPAPGGGLSVRARLEPPLEDISFDIPVRVACNTSTAPGLPAGSKASGTDVELVTPFCSPFAYLRKP